MDNKGLLALPLSSLLKQVIEDVLVEGPFPMSHLRDKSILLCLEKGYVEEVEQARLAMLSP